MTVRDDKNGLAISNEEMSLPNRRLTEVIVMPISDKTTNQIASEFRSYSYQE